MFPPEYEGDVGAAGTLGGGQGGRGGGVAAGNGGSAGAGTNNGGRGGQSMGVSGSGGNGGQSGSSNLGGNGGRAQTGTGGTANAGMGGMGQMMRGGSCPSDITVIFKRSGAQGGCGDSSCHVPGATAPDLTSPNPETRLLNVASSGTCQSRPYISATGSLLADKINPSPPCGVQMPFFNEGALSAADRACIEDWIDDVGGGG